MPHPQTEGSLDEAETFLHLLAWNEPSLESLAGCIFSNSFVIKCVMWQIMAIWGERIPKHTTSENSLLWPALCRAFENSLMLTSSELLLIHRDTRSRKPQLDS